MSKVPALLITGLLLAGLHVVTGALAAFQQCGSSQVGPEPLPGENVDAICDGDKDPRNAFVKPVVSGTGGSQRIGTSSGITYVPYDRLTTGADGQPCVTTGYTQLGSSPGDVAPDPFADQIQGAGGYNNVYAEYPPCPEQPRQPAQPAPAETRASTAARYWERIALPRPQPTIAPGRAITGKTAYLETRGAVAHTYTNETVFGTLRIDAVGSYTISWGDGETSGPYAYEGKPWPSGQIKHEYVNIGTYDILVTERWTATWSLGGERGVLRTLQTVGRIDDFPVEQIQAVIGR